MTTWGWIVMLLSVGTVCALFGACMYKVLTTPNETEHMHGFGDTPDRHEKD